MTKIQRPMTTIDALREVKKLISQLELVDYKRTERAPKDKIKSDYAILDRMQIWEWQQSLEKIEKHLQWGI